MKLLAAMIFSPVIWLSVRLCFPLAFLMLGACSGPYERLHDSFGVSKAPEGREIHVARITLTERGRVGVASIGDSTKIFISDDAIDFSGSGLFYDYRNVRIPASEVIGCSMICFSPVDRNVDLIIRGVNMDIAISDNILLRDWCWNNLVPAISASARREWLYESAGIPVFQLRSSSRSAFDATMLAACRGY